MTTLRTRVEKLEAGGARDGVDVEAEAAAYGELEHEGAGWRQYLSGDGETLTLVGAAGAVRYQVPGVDLRETV